MRIEDAKAAHDSWYQKAKAAYDTQFEEWRSKRLKWEATLAVNLAMRKVDRGGEGWHHKKDGNWQRKAVLLGWLGAVETTGQSPYFLM